MEHTVFQVQVVELMGTAATKEGKFGTELLNQHCSPRRDSSTHASKKKISPAARDTLHGRALWCEREAQQNQTWDLRCMSVSPRQTEQEQAYQDNSSNHSDTCLNLDLILIFMLNERIYLSLIIVYRRLCRTAELGRRKLGQFQLSQIWP